MHHLTPNLCDDRLLHRQGSPVFEDDDLPDTAVGCRGDPSSHEKDCGKKADSETKAPHLSHGLSLPLPHPPWSGRRAGPHAMSGNAGDYRKAWICLSAWAIFGTCLALFVS